MQDIDKNDVEISTLFKWKTKHTLLDEYNQPVKDVYIRIVGDAELNRARVYGLRRSAEMRKKLHDKESDEYLAFIPEFDFVDQELLIEGSVLFWTREFAQEAIKNIKMNLPTEPGSNATLEEQEKYQEEVDNWGSTREKQLRDYIEKKLEVKRQEINKLDKTVLYNEYIKMLINRLCEEEMMIGFKSMCVFLGTYNDEACTEKTFESMEEFNNLATELRNQLIGVYSSLDLDGENLKKLRGLTQ